MQLAILIGSGRVDVGGSKENPTYRLNAKDDVMTDATGSEKAGSSSHGGGQADDDAERQGRLLAALLAVVHTRPRASRADLDDAVKALGPSTADVNFALEALLRDGTLKVRSVPDADLDTPVYEAGPASQTVGKAPAGPKVETDEEGGIREEGLRGILR